MIINKFCYVLYYIIGYYMPKSNARISFGSKEIRRALAKRFIKYCGENVNFQKRATIPVDLCIGDNSGIGIRSEVGAGTVIGCNVMMGPECYIYTQNHCHERTDIPMIEQRFETVKPVIIGDDVWIGSRVTILPGVHIGKGCIIGAGAVVSKSAPDYSIIAGNPAKVVKKRERVCENQNTDPSNIIS